MGFQTTVNLQQAPAVAGDFATANPRASFPAGEGQYVAGASGVTVGRFAWIDAWCPTPEPASRMVSSTASSKR